MEKIKVYIADSNILIREGLKVVLEENDNIEVVAEAKDRKKLLSDIVEVNPDILFLNYYAPDFSVEDIQTVLKVLPDLNVLAITTLPGKERVEEALKAGIKGHILRDCDEQEIVDAVNSLSEGEQFYCGKVLEVLKDKVKADNVSTCEPVSLSERELEIIKHIAEGKTNKDIAEELYLSTHTVMTHRKNIMNKLGINNTAGIVIYAVKENLISPQNYLFESKA